MATTAPDQTAPAPPADAHGLRRSLGLRDLVPMQILLVIGPSWAGIAAQEGSTHVTFWLLGVLLLFVPVAGVVDYCSRLWPQEGGVYQWTKHALGPFAGFLAAWNFGLWAVLITAPLGIQTAASLSYALGPSAAWMVDNDLFIAALNLGIVLILLCANIPGMVLGRWVSHFGTAVTVAVALLLVFALLVHPTATPGHPHHAPQPPFSFAFPVIGLMSLNLFGKLSFNGLTGLEQVAVFAGETRGPERAILRSAWIAAPGIALIYILTTASMLEYTPADRIDLTGPIPQVVAAAFGAGRPGSTIDPGALFGRLAILALAIALLAQQAVKGPRPLRYSDEEEVSEELGTQAKDPRRVTASDAASEGRCPGRGCSFRS